MTPRRIVAYGTPKPKGSLRHLGNGRMIEQVAGSKEWRSTIAIAAAQQRDRHAWESLTGAIRCDVECVVPRPKSVRRIWPITRSSGDVDKLARNVLDALVDAAIIGDDSQVTDLRITKQYPDGERPQPGVWITLWESTGAPAKLTVVRARNVYDGNEGA